MFSNLSEKTLSIVLFLSAAIWGMYWFPLRTIENIGITSSWSVAIFNACPLIILCPLIIFYYKTLTNFLNPTIFASIMIGLAFTFYANGLLETSVIRATLLYYLTVIWSTLIGIVWLSESLTIARIFSIVIAFLGLFLLLFNGSILEYQLNIGDLFSLLSGIFWAIGVASLNRWSKIPIIPLTGFVFIFSFTFSIIFAIYFFNDPYPEISLIKLAFPTAVIWSILILLPCFFIIFRVSQFLLPGRVGILTMSEIVVAMISATILIPNESLFTIQWLGATAIISAGIIEVFFAYKKINN